MLRSYRTDLIMATTTYLGLRRYTDGYNPYDFYSIYYEPTVKQKPNFDFGAALLSEYDVLDKILGYLCFRDLNNVAKLSVIWARNVEIELKKRLSPILFSFNGSCYNSPKPIASKPKLCLVFNTNLKLDSSICIHKIDSEQPKTVIEFLEYDLLPIKCPLVALRCRTILSSFTEIRGLHGLIFPSIPNLNLKIFRVDVKCRNLAKLVDEEIGVNCDLTGLLVFGVHARKNFVKKFLAEVQRRQPYDNFAFGGGLILGMEAFNTGERLNQVKIDKKCEMLFVAFTKPKRAEVAFNAYSMVIPEFARSFTEIEQYFIELSTHYRPRKYSIAFRITCASREEQVEKEMRLFKKYFPETDVLGFNGGGEFGWDCYKSEDDEEPAVKKVKLKFREQAFHQLTTIILLFTWGKERKKFT